MTIPEILARLESLGDPGRRAVNRKAGAPDNQFGVRLGDLRTVSKGLKAQHALAHPLCETGNVEAQLLATRLIRPWDPANLTLSASYGE